MKYYIILVFLLLSMPLVLADNRHDTLSIKIYNRTVMGDDYEMTIGVDFNSSKDEFNDITYTFVVNLKNETTFSDTLAQTFSDIPYIVYFEDTAENIDFAKEYYECLAEKIGFERGWQQCQNELTDYKGENTTLCKEDLDECSLSLKEKGLDLGAKNEKILNLEDENEDTKNSKYIWGVIG